MNNIRQLFDTRRHLDRPIEKVITYQNRTDAQIQAEISEYVVTDHIDENFASLLEKMRLALDGGGGHEIGVWVSGFYGSGKSSFTKYLGFALDREMKVGGEPFLKLLQNQLKTASTKALFNTVSTRFNPTVIFLDLASEMLAGASMEEISTVLYLKVLLWAGYSEDLKVAELERMLEADGRYEEFKARAKQELGGIPWEEAHNQPLVAIPTAARLAIEFYPAFFKTPDDFQNLTIHVTKAENKRAQEMVDLIRRKSGRPNILFIIDEVGQYVAAKPQLILNLDGLAKNLKEIGGGSVWLFATAQQTLTEDNPNAMLNATGLFKLKDRFPLHYHLEASDIREICHRRLLTKSAAGETELKARFQSHGASLRTATLLQDGGVYASELNTTSFLNLYPFLPAHFEVLIQLLGRLARKTGGLGLRSAIKVVQEVLVERRQGLPCLADAPVGRLANTVTFFDSLRRDIANSFPHILDGVEEVGRRLPGDTLCEQVAKTIAILQILENLPATAPNVAALLPSEVTTGSLKDEVEKAVDRMLKDGMIPLGEKDGKLRFLSKTATSLQKQFDSILLRQADLRNELNGVLRTLFTPLPSARLNGVRPVTAGLRVIVGGGQSASLAGEKEPIQLHIEFAAPAAYEATRSERENESRAPSLKASPLLLARTDADTERLAETICRCRKFLDQHKSAADPDVREFVRIIEGRLQRNLAELERKTAESLRQGSFVAHGSHQSVSGLHADLQESARLMLGSVAERVFDRYAEAPHQAETELAERFLKTNLDRITSAEDPLGLVTRVGGKPQVKTSHKALTSLTDFLNMNGQVEGRRLLDHFSGPPFGWSKDTLRYLLAAAFVSGQVKLRISGKDHQVKNDDSLAALSNNRSLGPIGVSLREERPDPEACARTCDRLQTLTGENLLPLEDDLASAAKKHFPGYQSACASLSVELRTLGLPAAAVQRCQDLVADLADVVSGDGSDVIPRLGGAQSLFFDHLCWAKNLRLALDQGLRLQLEDAAQLSQAIRSLPDAGLPGQLKQAAREPLGRIEDLLKREAFFTETAALGQATLQANLLVTQTVSDLTVQQAQTVNGELARWQESPDWADLDDAERGWVNIQAGELVMNAPGDLEGLKSLLNHDFYLNRRLRDLAGEVAKRAQMAREARRKVEPKNDDPNPKSVSVVNRELLVPAVFTGPDQVDQLVTELHRLKRDLTPDQHLRITWKTLP